MTTKKTTVAQAVRTVMNGLSFNPILATDSYKLCHAFAYPDYVIGMHSYIEARTKGEDILVPFGLQMWIRKFLTVPVTMAHIDEAERFATAHGEPFKRDGWEYVVQRYKGFMPVKIRAVPEGTPIRSGNAIVTIECTDPKVFWLASYLETALLRAVWYPTTIASMDYKIKGVMRRFYEATGADMAALDFALHDFGGRGVTCAEQAEIGGAAHLVNFRGSDTIEGIRAANHFYFIEMAGFSVPATEHSIECSFGDGPGEIEYIRHVLKNLAKPGGIVSIVIDGYDVYRCAELLCTDLKQEIIDCKAKVVFRPDSGDMEVVVPRILRIQDMAFGHVVNKNKFKKINIVGCLQGDGVDHLSVEMLLGNLMSRGYASDNIVFGSGGALLQKVNRDTFKFAQKASAILVQKASAILVNDGDRKVWRGISKNPITDPGKKSKEGRQMTVRSRMTGEIMTFPIGDGKLDSEWEDIMVTVYDCGSISNETNMVEIRERVEARTRP